MSFIPIRPESRILGSSQRYRRGIAAVSLLVVAQWSAALAQDDNVRVENDSRVNAGFHVLAKKVNPTVDDHATTAEAPLLLLLHSVKDEYVLGEPVKFVVTLSNVSEEPIAIVSLDYLNANMEFMELEITSPNDSVVVRWTFHDYFCGAFVSRWRGEPLIPGDSIEVSLTPNASWIVGQGKDWSPTFPMEGTYSVRAVYRVDLGYMRLWKGASCDQSSARHFSAPVSVRFKRPTAVEREILDAYWTRGGYWISLGEEGHDCMFDRLELLRVLEKYPAHSMSKYLRFGLARELLGDYTEEGAQEAVELLEALRASNPGFRYVEVALNLAQGYRWLDQNERALAILDALLVANPPLERNKTFMMSLIKSRTDDPRAWSEWRVKRKHMWDNLESKELQ